MPATLNLADPVFEDTIANAVRLVFQTMLATNAELSPNIPEAEAICPPTPQVVGNVAFTGSMNGLIYLFFDSDFASICAGRMLRMSQQELIQTGNELINDVIGEITNMVVGTFKNQLSDKGYPCRLIIPSILRASQFTIEPISSAQRRTYYFRIGEHYLTADLIMQPVG